MVKKEDPADLERQKEDIENLLSSLETAFSEGSITQEHYNEVRQKNSTKLEEIKKKLKQVEKPKPAVSETEPLSKEEPAKKSKAKEEPAKKEAEAKKPAMPEEVTSKISAEKAEADAEKVKEKIIFELSPKIDKINIKIEKIKAFVDALREEKTGERELTQRLTEEVGETRSLVNSTESRLSEIEMKLEDVSETLTDLKPQRFAKELQKKEEELKLHEARIEKLDDMNSNILKRVNEIQIILEKLGNIESIAMMTKDISKKMISIDDKEKKITRLADKIDNMFAEINKRLEEFMFYKAKQDSLDDLSKEMLKSLDELTTKLTRYAEKDDLELLRDTLENKINELMKVSVAPTGLMQTQQEKSEVESLMKMLEEQFKKGLLSKKDYEKAKDANMQRIRELEKGSKSAAIPIQETLVEQIPLIEEESKPEETKEFGFAQAAKIAQLPSPEEAKTEEKSAQKKEPTAILKEEKPEKTKPEKRTPVSIEIEKKPKEQSPPKEEIHNQPKLGKKEKMLFNLEDSFNKGIISQKAYESARKIIMAKKL